MPITRDVSGELAHRARDGAVGVPPKTMVELEKREFKEMWDKAWKKEWDGLNHHDCFLHGLLIEELVSMGVMGGRDGKKI